MKILPALAAALAFGGLASAADLGIANVSEDFAIHHLFVSPANVGEWGPDQLGDEVIEPGETFALIGFEIDTYDIKIIDETGDECVLAGVDFVDTPILAFDGLACAAGE